MTPKARSISTLSTPTEVPSARCRFPFAGFENAYEATHRLLAAVLLLFASGEDRTVHVLLV
jgi:hypothetical protein